MEGLTGSQGNSLRMRIFYGRACPRAHSSARLGIQNSDLNEYKSADNPNQFSLHQNRNQKERYTLAADREDQSHVSRPRASARGQPVTGPIAGPRTHHRTPGGSELGRHKPEING